MSDHDQIGFETGRMSCPKCGARSGNDWDQCGRRCPLGLSPHYDPETAAIYAPNRRALRGEIKRLLDRAEVPGQASVRHRLLSVLVPYFEAILGTPNPDCYACGGQGFLPVILQEFYWEVLVA